MDKIDIKRKTREVSGYKWMGDGILNDFNVDRSEPAVIIADHMDIEFEGKKRTRPEVKTHTVTFLTAGQMVKQLEIPEDTTILEAGWQEGMDLPSVCESGSCTHCVARIAAGKVYQESPVCLDDNDLKKGYACLCQAMPRENLVVHTHAFNDLYLSKNLDF